MRAIVLESLERESAKRSLLTHATPLPVVSAHIGDTVDDVEKPGGGWRQNG